MRIDLPDPAGTPSLTLSLAHLEDATYALRHAWASDLAAPPDEAAWREAARAVLAHAETLGAKTIAVRVVTRASHDVAGVYGNQRGTLPGTHPLLLPKEIAIWRSAIANG